MTRGTAMLLFLPLLTGCSLLNRGVIKANGVTVTGVKDAGKPAVIATTSAGTSIPLPEGSTVTVTKIAPIAAAPAKEGVPAVKAEPAKEVTEIRPAGPTEYHHTESTVKADTGTVDTSVAVHRIEAEERRPLLYCAIGGVVAGLAFMYVRFQAIAVMCFIGAGCFFLAWRIAEISPWVGGLFLVAAVAGFAFYKRAEWDSNGDGIPDFLQNKQPPTQ